MILIAIPLFLLLVFAITYIPLVKMSYDLVDYGDLNSIYGG